MIGSINMLFRRMIERKVTMPLDLAVELGRVREDTQKIVAFKSWSYQDVRDRLFDLGFVWGNQDQVEWIGEQIIEHIDLDEAITEVIRECAYQLKLDRRNK